MLTATSEVSVTDILPTDYDSLVRGIARKHDLEVSELYRIPNGLLITLAASWGHGSDNERFINAVGSVFNAFNSVFNPPPKRVGHGKSNVTAVMPKDLAEYNPEDQPWFPRKVISSEELPPEQTPDVKSLIDVVLLVATEVEVTAVLEALEPLDGRSKILRVNSTRASYYVGRIGKANVAVGLSSMGSVGRDAAITTTNRAISTWHPKAVIMVGIAFGLKPGKQEIGDVLVSEKITPYEPQRVGKRKIPRGAPALAGKTLLARFKAIREWRFTRPDGSLCQKRTGEIISGEKLVDNKKLRDELAKQFPDAEGGEMEGAGLYAGAEDAGVEWIVIKAICDWGMGKNSTHQALAAASAVSLAVLMLQDASSLYGLSKAQVEASVAAPSPIRFTGTTTKTPPGREELYRERDHKTIRRLLQNLPLRFLAHFFEQAQIDRVLFDVFNYWEGFNGEVTALDFRIFDKELLNVVSNFHQAWSRSLGYGEYFLSTPDANIYRYRNLLPGENHASYDNHYKQYHIDVLEAQRALIELVNQVSTKLPEIDLHETSREAEQLVADWRAAVESRLDSKSKSQTAKRVTNKAKTRAPKKTSLSKEKPKSPAGRKPRSDK